MSVRWQASRCLVQVVARSAGSLRQSCWLMALFVCCTCRSSSSLATLQLTLGAVERDFAAQPKAWKAAEVGASFALGDGIQTGTGSSALLELEGGDQLSLDPNTQIRFANTLPGPRNLDLELVLGSVSVQAVHESLSIQTRAGPARVEKGSRVSLAASPEGLRFLVQVGQASFGSSEPVTAGTGMLLAAQGQWTPIGLPGPAAKPQPEPSSAPAAAVPLQIVAQITGRNARMRTDKGWAALPEGTMQLNAGAELSLAHQTSVALEYLDQRALLQQDGRYVIAPRPGVLVAAASGSLSAGSSGKVRIEVPGGVIEVVPEGQVSIHLNKQLTRVDVQAREALLESALGVERVGKGERGTLLESGKLGLEGRGLDYADTQLAAGESLVIHDPAPPTAVRFAFGSACPESGVLQLFHEGRADSYAAGRAAVSLLVQPGSYRYELRCGADKASAASGSVTVLRDAGTRRMAARQPSAALQADGRDYTVLYQNRLPDITLGWRDAPAGASSSLVHEFGSRSETLALTEPEHVFASGTLAEGSHVLHFVGGGKISRRTTINVVFDNAAPKASINTPVASSAAPGEELNIAGTALPGWDVSIDGHPAPCDAQGRFSLPVAWPNELHALSIRLRHPERGTHVFLRRSQRRAAP
jgi:ferric-dicitrate binding protein FerR (iron transport regulator)